MAASRSCGEEGVLLEGDKSELLKIMYAKRGVGSKTPLPDPTN